jgi:DNA polymerase-4
MHVDLNSCFATVEQQAHLTYRGKPVVVAAYNSPGGCVISPSIESKKIGIRVGMSVREAKLLCREVIVCTPDPQKYRAVYLKLIKLFRDYSPEVTPKSIDEAIIDFSHTQVLFKRSLTGIGLEIKQRIKKEIGDWLTCNIGIATNRFLAKQAASLHKPDGLDVITYRNLRQVLASLKLVDLYGINTRFEARLNSYGIFTPLEFLDSPLVLLKQAFQSIIGYYWYLRLRGFEIDAVDFPRKSFGQEYALGKKTADPKELAKLLMKLCEKMGRRLRHRQMCAYGVHVSLVYDDWTFWHQGVTFPTPMYSTLQLFQKALLIANRQPQPKTVRHLGVSCYHLAPMEPAQLDLFPSSATKNLALTRAVDRINDRYGEYTLSPALMMGMESLVLDRIAFGGVKDLEVMGII